MAGITWMLGGGGVLCKRQAVLVAGVEFFGLDPQEHLLQAFVLVKEMEFARFGEDVLSEKSQVWPN
jgi:hypothetical protein